MCMHWSESLPCHLCLVFCFKTAHDSDSMVGLDPFATASKAQDAPDVTLHTSFIKMQREPHPEAAVSLRKMVTFVKWSSSKTEFLV